MSTGLAFLNFVILKTIKLCTNIDPANKAKNLPLTQFMFTESCLNTIF